MGTSAADADKKLEAKVVQTGANRLFDKWVKRGSTQ
jgi:hypothetical protein